MNERIREIVDTWVRLDARPPTLGRRTPRAVERTVWLRSLALSARCLRFFAASCVRAPTIRGVPQSLRDRFVALLEETAEGRIPPEAERGGVLAPFRQDHHPFWAQVIPCVLNAFDDGPFGPVIDLPCDSDVATAAVCAAFYTTPPGSSDPRPELEYQGRLLAGIAAPGWTWNPEWRTDPVLSLARQMYDTRTFDRMPDLADALQDAGCDATDWLVLMRDGAWPWCRGCHILDSIHGTRPTSPSARTLAACHS